MRHPDPGGLPGSDPEPRGFWRGIGNPRSLSAGWKVRGARRRSSLCTFFGENIVAQILPILANLPKLAKCYVAAQNGRFWRSHALSKISKISPEKSLVKCWPKSANFDQHCRIFAKICDFFCGYFRQFLLTAGPRSFGDWPRNAP